MTISFAPFANSVAVSVDISPTVYVLWVGKLWDTVPMVVPDGLFRLCCHVDLPAEDAEAMEWLRANLEWVRRRIYEWLIAPMGMN